MSVLYDAKVVDGIASCAVDWYREVETSCNRKFAAFGQTWKLEFGFRKNSSVVKQRAKWISEN